MRIVVAPDSFKGCMTARQAAEAVRRGIKRVFPDADVVLVPMADGGEGTVQSLVDATGGRIETVTVTGPLGKPVEAFFGILGDGVTGVIEMAAASGLPLVPEHQRNPLITTTYGTGELIRSALDAGCRRLIIGLGGSATNDGGAGMAAALGARLLDRHGALIRQGGGALVELDRIDLSGLDPRVAQCEVVAACDVDNPLTGPAGAAAVFGPQKGATPQVVTQLDAALAHYATVVHRDTGDDITTIAGAGAAGGLGAGLIAFLGATLRSGAAIAVEATGLVGLCAGADLVITGEGRIDGQTVRGKTPVGVAQAAKLHNVPVVALVGSVGPGAEALYDAGIDSIFSIVPGPVALDEALRNGATYIEETAERVMRLWLAVHNRSAHYMGQDAHAK